jgi:hypothetical protein
MPRMVSLRKRFLAGAPGAAVAAGEAAVSGHLDVTETSETGAALTGSAGHEVEREYGPAWERLDTADAPRR